MHIGFDVSQAARARAGCGVFSHAIIEALLELAPQDRYSLYPSFGDSYFDPLMPLRNPYRGRDVAYGPRHFTRGAAAAFWNSPGVEASLGRPDIVHANNYWCPVQFTASRLVYTCYDLSFVVDPGWTTEVNRVGCFEGVFRSSTAADWVIVISEASRRHYLQGFPAFPEARVRVVYPWSRFGSDAGEGHRSAQLSALAPGRFWLSVGT